jgi:SAM-dependent methyltransferase
LIIQNILNNGIVHPQTGQNIVSSDVIIQHENYRETIQAGMLISRHRAILIELNRLVAKYSLIKSRQCKVYAPEALTDFALFLRSQYPRFIGSEYAVSDIERESLFPIISEDLMNLSFADNVFDLIFSNDVFEHVPSLDRALFEIYRVLNKNGILISTFPFAYSKEKSILKASVKNDSIIYYSEPEYHGNPMRPTEGSLVFEIPSWDLIDRALTIGFKDAYFSFICSAKYGVTGKDINGIFVFVALKSI